MPTEPTRIQSQDTAPTSDDVATTGDAIATKPRRVNNAALEIDLLLAVHRVNQEISNYEELLKYDERWAKASGCPMPARVAKAELEALSERGIAAAIAAGRLVCAGIADEQTVYIGEGYCFDAKIMPTGPVKALSATEHADLHRANSARRPPRIGLFKSALAVLRQLPHENVAPTDLPTHLSSDAQSKANY